MYPWAYARYHYATYPGKQSPAVNLRANLTVAEIARLTTIRARFCGHLDCVE